MTRPRSKGGRSGGLYLRITPEAKQRLITLAEMTGRTQADVIHRLINAEWARMQGTRPDPSPPAKEEGTTDNN